MRTIPVEYQKVDNTVLYQVNAQASDQVYCYLYEHVNDYIDNLVWWAVCLPLFRQLQEGIKKDYVSP